MAQLLEAVEALTGAERLLLYLRLPTGVPPHDPLKQPVNPLGSRYVHNVLKMIKTKQISIALVVAYGMLLEHRCQNYTIM